MFKIDTLGARYFEKSHLSVKVVAIDVINEVRRLCFAGALLPALFPLKSFFLLEKVNF